MTWKRKMSHGKGVDLRIDNDKLIRFSLYGKLFLESKNPYLIYIFLCLFSPCVGAKIFRYRQSSDWFFRNGSRRFRYSRRPRGILSRAAVSFRRSGSRCGHTGLNLWAKYIIINILSKDIRLL